MSLPRRLAAPALVLVLMLAGCGGDSGEPSAADRDAIETSLDRAFTTNDPAVCTELATKRLIAVLYRGSLQACKRQTASGSKAKAVRASEIKVDGKDAVAKVRVTTSSGAVQPLTVGLKHQNGVWKLDLIGA